MLMSHNGEEIKVGDSVRVGVRIMIVDEIIDAGDHEVAFFCVDEDGGDHELTKEQIDIC